MDNTIDAVKIPTPGAGMCNFTSIALTNGATVYNPQKPYTTEGIAANKSITFRKIFGIRPFG